MQLTLEEMRAHLGVEIQRQGSVAAIARTTPSVRPSVWTRSTRGSAERGASRAVDRLRPFSDLR